MYSVRKKLGDKMVSLPKVKTKLLAKKFFVTRIFDDGVCFCHQKTDFVVKSHRQRKIGLLVMENFIVKNTFYCSEIVTYYNCVFKWN